MIVVQSTKQLERAPLPARGEVPASLLDYWQELSPMSISYVNAAGHGPGSLLKVPPPSGGPLWTGVLDPSRAVDWSGAGVIGGIPSSNWSQSGSTIAAGASAATIQTALNNAAPNTFVLLGPGAFTLSTSLTIPSNVALRGSGANSTILTFTGQSRYYWGTYTVGFIGNYTGGFEGSPPGMSGSLNCTGSVGPPSTYTGCTQLLQWTGTNGQAGVYTKGATVLNLSGNPGNLAIGGMLQLTQTDDTALPPANTGPYVGQLQAGTSQPGYSREGQGLTYQNTSMRQIVKVVAKNGSAITVTPGIYADIWTSAKNPVAFWWTGDTQKAGIEQLSIIENFSDSSALWSTVAFFQASDCWATDVIVQPHNGGVGAGNSTRHGFIIHASRNITVQNSWLGPMFGGGAQSTTSYGLTNVQSSASLIQNNIFFNVESPIITTGGPSGDVYAYNFDPGVCTPNSGCTGLVLGHDVGGMYNLVEGNVGPLYRKDTFHGNEMFWTLFRNRFTATEQNESTEPAIDLYAGSRYYNVVGNVLGSGGVSTLYECTASTNSNCSRFGTSVFRLGYGGEGALTTQECESSGGATGTGCVAPDAQVKGTLMRWGNYDTVNAASRFLSSEVPSGISDHANPVPASQALPSSFYTSAKPGYFSTQPFPPIGPDVSGGNVSGVGGHANTIPAQDCYNAASGIVGNFNPVSCYGS